MSVWTFLPEKALDKAPDGGETNDASYQWGACAVPGIGYYRNAGVVICLKSLTELISRSHGHAHKPTHRAVRLLCSTFIAGFLPRSSLQRHSNILEMTLCYITHTTNVHMANTAVIFAQDISTHLCDHFSLQKCTKISYLFTVTVWYNCIRP